MAVEKSANLEEETIEYESEPDLLCRSEGRSVCDRPILFIHEHTYLRRKAARITCPNCLRAIETVVKRQRTCTTHFFALLLVPLCLCVLLYCSKTLRDSIHHCPSCGVYLGSYFASAREAILLCFRARRTRERHHLSKTSSCTTLSKMENDDVPVTRDQL